MRISGRACKTNLIGLGYADVEEAVNGEDALYRIDKNHPDIVLADAWLSKLDCIQVMHGTKSLSFGSDLEPSFIIISIVNNQNIFGEATESGAEYCMVKPFDYNSLSGPHQADLRRARAAQSEAVGRRPARAEGRP